MIRNKDRGFTLIELLVVIAIIGVLASVVLASLNSARAKARDAARLSDMHQVSLALELYFSNNGTYPPENASPQALPEELVSTGLMSSLPNDPSFTGGNNYRYYAGNINCTTSTPCYLLLMRSESISGLTATWCKAEGDRITAYANCQ